MHRIDALQAAILMQDYCYPTIGLEIESRYTDSITKEDLYNSLIPRYRTRDREARIGTIDAMNRYAFKVRSKLETGEEQNILHYVDNFRYMIALNKLH